MPTSTPPVHQHAEERTSILYSALLGASWATLAAPVRWAHSVGEEKTGRFRIVHGSRWLTRLALLGSRLPKAALAAETNLTIIADESGEKWDRKFNGEEFTTLQWNSGGSLTERFGPWELRFALRVGGGALFYEQCGARYCLGRWRMPMPRVFAPFVEAKEWADGPEQVRVMVKVTLPIVGLLIAYDGTLDMKSHSS